MTETVLSTMYSIGNSIDTFAPGHYARVFDARDQRGDRHCAFKVMRAEHLTNDGQPRWEALAFINEADLLLRMAESPHVMHLYDCGYISAGEDRPRAGEIDSFGLEVDAFRQASLRYAAKRWRPYLALELLPRSENLLYLMKPNTPGTRWRLPTEEGLDLAMQFAEVLRIAHRQRIIYLDHKLEHVYWDGTRLRIIDWNSSKLVTDSDQVLAGQVQADLHNLCVGILYPVFTGLSPQKGTLMPQPADQTEVDSRYNEINSLDFGSEPSLSEALQAVLQQGARRQLSSAAGFLAALERVSVNYGWQTAPPALQEARVQVRAGLARLRQGQDAIREARDLLREAAVMEDVNEDIEGELRRLLTRINDMLNCRVIP